MNDFVLKKVRQAILQAPQHFDMSVWDCGSAACIAGWVCRLSGIKVDIDASVAELGESVMDTAMRCLKISQKQANNLFFSGRWPEQFQGENEDRDAENAARRIDYFVKTGGE